MASSPPETFPNQGAQPWAGAELIASLPARIDAEALRGLVDDVVGIVGGDEDAAFDLRVCLAELHGNALRHGGGATRVQVWRLPGGDRLLVAVGDRCTAPPVRDVEPGPDDEGGRGLMLVAALSLAGGHVVHAAGKDVWFAVAIPGGHREHATGP
ncbi:ATP-binding protein [Embleya sp. NPDC050493]|uniref:ATP-binding protein n=1 Tax=Embleya sp. NPDC050493 TaxID=3363989 RepID=UPI0037A4573F